RGDELAGEGLHLPPHRLPCRRRLVFTESFGRRSAAERERALDRLRLGGGQVERLRDRRVEGPSAPLEHAGELADTPVRDGERRPVVTDRDGDERRLRGLGALVAGRRER